MSQEERDRLRMIDQALKSFPKLLAEKEKAFKQREKAIKAFFPLAKKLLNSWKKFEKETPKPRDKNASTESPATEKSHRWRACPRGKHWVVQHDRKVPVSDLNPDGITDVEGHCRENRSAKDELHFEEIERITSNAKPDRKWLPTGDDLGFPYGNEFDRIIAIWVQYWNEVLSPQEPLSANFVKALMASESGFRKELSIKAGPRNYAHGLLQVTDQTIQILGDIRGELRDHLIFVDRATVNEPGANIAIAVRWLFHKQDLASRRLKRLASWEESLIEYKGYLEEYRKQPDRVPKGIKNFVEHFRRLEARE